VSVPTTADTIDENDETFSIASGTTSATGTINDNDAAVLNCDLIADGFDYEGSPALFRITA
jgi:hypothetical protein